MENVCVKKLWLFLSCSFKTELLSKKWNGILYKIM